MKQNIFTTSGNNTIINGKLITDSVVSSNFVREGVQQIQLRTEDGENGDLGAVAP